MEEREEATMEGVQKEVKGKRKERKKEERGKVGARNGRVASGDGVLKRRGSKEVGDRKKSYLLERCYAEKQKEAGGRRH